jgi:prophage antirepressor-like protein
MSLTLIDIYNNVLTYKGNDITIIVDDTNMPWFSAINIATIFEYVNKKKAIAKHVSAIDKKFFSELRQFVKNVPPNTQPHAIYINESGLFELSFKSDKKIAVKFRRWIVEKVLPSIRQHGSFAIEEKYKQQYAKLNAKLKAIKDENKRIKNNQKKNTYNKGGLVHILRPIDSTRRNILRIGKTTNFNKQLNTYNTSVPDNMEILFTLAVDDPDAVKSCVKDTRRSNIYRKNKDYYQCSIQLLKNTMMTCNNIIKGEFYCDQCQSRIESVDTFIEQKIIDHEINDDDILYLQIHKNQTGGSEIDHYEKYLKYKGKYISLKADLINQEAIMIINWIRYAIINSMPNLIETTLI